MLAYRLLKGQTQPQFQEVPDPHAGPGQIVVKVAGSGLCHTDFTVIGREQSYWKDDGPPFTLGHEIAGWVEDLGSGVKGFQRGDAVAVNPSWASCGHCHMCRSGEENFCLYQKAIRAGVRRFQTRTSCRSSRAHPRGSGSAGGITGTSFSVVRRKY